MLPFCDVPAAVAELQRCAPLGFETLLFCNRPQEHGQRWLRDRHRDPIWAAVHEAGLPIRFHVGGGHLAAQMADPAGIGQKANFARVSAVGFLDNARGVVDLITGGIPHRYPELELVSVESDAGWIPFIVEALDWPWKSSRVASEPPDYDPLPGESFRRQIYASFWFEEKGIAAALHGTDGAAPSQASTGRGGSR